MMFVTVNNCARCGETHKDLKFDSFTHPVEDGEGLWEYWALCPVVREPVIMKADWKLSGIDKQVATGHIDADTSEPCRPLESIV